MAFLPWVALSNSDFETLDREKVPVLFPIASTEQHGPHLPVGTDTMIVQEIVKRCEPKFTDLDFLVLPTLWIAKSIEHKGFLGVLSLQTETFIAVLHDLAASVAASGFRKLVLINWHGGNSDLLSSIIRDLHQRHHLQVFLIDGLWLFPDAAELYPQASQQYDLHAGRFETGIMASISSLYVKADRINEEQRAANHQNLKRMFEGFHYILPEGGTGRLGWETKDFSPDGVVGNVSGFSAEEGSRFLEMIVERVEAILREIYRFEFDKQSIDA